MTAYSYNDNLAIVILIDFTFILSTQCPRFKASIFPIFNYVYLLNRVKNTIVIEQNANLGRKRKFMKIICA